MSETARERILGRLRSAPRLEVPHPGPEPPAGIAPERGALIERLKTLMETVRTEVHRVPQDGWVERLQEILRTRSIRTLLYAPATNRGSALASAWQQNPAGLPELVAYAEPIENFKDRLFAMDASLTEAAGAVADTGALILRPSAAEPRLMSLVPPVHIAVLAADTVYPSLSEAMRQGAWPGDMPTNLLLISGPSKTADIELVLAFGVHGPKELIVLIVE
jgi:L-lactate dehydrogenase complex protein LldG